MFRISIPQKIVHLDLKPENVVVCNRDSDQVCELSIDSIGHPSL